MNTEVSPSRNSTTITTTPIEITDSEPLPLDDDVQIINSQDKCVTLDYDSDVIIEENNPVIIDIDSDDLEIIERSNTPIVIEDDDRNCVINPLNVIKKKQAELFDIVCRENSLLAQVIEDAINLDASGSMKRIIQRTLIPLYLSCNITYKKSNAFKNTLKRTSILLDTAPHLKYSHIKSLCEILKYVKIKKVPVRIQTSESTPRKRKQKYTKPRKTKKRKKFTHVKQTKEKKKKNDTEKTTNSKANTNKKTRIEIEISNIKSTSPSSNKENIANENIQETNNISRNDSNNTGTTETTHNTLGNNTGFDPNDLLRPHYAVTTQITPPEPSQQTVESLERQIASLKMELEKIEEQEVTDDYITSPYIIADFLKSKIVKLYKQLCDRMGVESTKRHEVKLQVVNGHPPGPARCLEEYINDNIDEYGNPPFPDIFEVVRCVERAVEEDRLMWNRKKIVAEAQVLLKHYGHAIQKRRKKREWRDMVSRCKEELLDPADLDPALEAKLLENSRIAKKNEDEIVDKYARLEKENSTNPAFTLSLETAADDSDSDNEDIPNHMAVETNIQEATILNIADSTTNTENIHGLTNIQSGLSITHPEFNIQGAINPRNILEMNPQGCSSIINSTNIVECQQNGSSLTNPDLADQKNYQILVLNSQNNSLPNLHGRVCFINSTPVLLTKIQDGSSFINSTNNSEGNLQNGPNLINPNNLAANLQNEPNYTNNLPGNGESRPNFVSNLEGNLLNGSDFINSLNNTPANVQNENYYINSNTIDYQQCFNNFTKSLINLQRNQQNNPSINTSNHLGCNLQNGQNNKECNLRSPPIDSTSKEKQSTVINIGNLEYNRTIMIDSTSDTDNERKEHTDTVMYTNNVKERDKSDVDEIEYKIKVKQEEDDVIKLLSELGSDCVATVFDIEDPFLVIEISDSSDEGE